ncbi:MAG: 3-oxoacyl-[acyl-carrier-protein] reductase [Deltaproteobacteria bacterium]|nr:3-oxoacyl-[acyl-carrier-protein] reductase [Deltaproteobacteria bacterium]
MQRDTKIALITGSSRGIGRAVAMKLADAGIFVYINYLKQEAAAEQTLAEIKSAGGMGALCPFDVADRVAVIGAVADILLDQGRIDILVNSAGVVKGGLIARTKEADWESLVDTNLKGTFNCCQAVSRPMIKQRWGRIVNVASVVAETGNAGQVAYAAVKAGILGLTKSLARELGSRNICVNAVSPGLIETDMTAKLTDQEREQIRSKIPLGRAGKPDEVAGVIAFLVSPQADYITGQVIRINGGLYM